MITPFINFSGQAAEAIAFYETVFEVANKQIMFYKDMPADLKRNFSPDSYGHVLHAELTINGTMVWIGDTVHGIRAGNMVSLAVPFATKEAVEQVFEALKVGGAVIMALAPTFYSPLFGVLKDKFGVVWHLICRNNMDPVISFDKDFANREIIVKAQFEAPLAVIWDAFTNPEKLEKWWGPKPYKAVTKKMDFREGGQWLYSMKGPKGEGNWALSEFKSIDPQNSFVVYDAFSDENGVVDPNSPTGVWATRFSEKNGITTVVNSISYEKEEDMKQFLEMGFESGYRMGLGQLAELLETTAN